MEHLSRVPGDGRRYQGYAMGPVESEMLSYIQRCLGQGRLSVPATEIMNAVVPADHPEWRHRPAYRHGLDRLLRRHFVNATDAPDGTRHYFIGTYASPELRSSLGLTEKS
jgi:hypothetical protein